MKTARVPAFDHFGLRHMLEGYPSSFEDWTVGEDMSREHEKFVDSLEEAFCGVMYKTRLRGRNMCQTYETILEGGEAYMVRKPLIWMDKEKQKWALERAACETNLLEWLEKQSAIIPAPRVLYSIPAYSILTKAPGKTLFECFGSFDVYQKETTIISYAHIIVELFQLNVPQRIGTSSAGPIEDTLTIVPRIGAPPARLADRVYDRLEDYVAYLFEIAYDAALAMETCDAQELLAKLEKHVARVISALPKRALRCALMHEDLSETNVLVDDKTGVVTGIVDWEYHSVVPRCMAAQYPSWLRYDGVHDPAFARRGPSGVKWWIESPEESLRLNHLFEQVVKSKSETFYEALTVGKKLRETLEWLLQIQEGEQACERMRKWMQAERLL